ncbi:hypothetical protein QUA54_31520 [Microcoleus sp. MOSTC5]|uniref:hypothetical protein n=1 Tax=Microcoleus sp. MOSTC5 TaxID=3055378 RepID=UPI002FCFDB37
MQLLTAKFNQIASEIDVTNAQIAALQTKLSELQEFQQQLLSVEQAVQSALSQTDTALMMLHHVDPTQIEIFKDALVTKFSSDVIGILEPTNALTDPVSEPEPTAPYAPRPDKTDTVVDVQVKSTELTEPEPLQENNVEQALQEGDIEQALNKMPLPSLRSLAKLKGTDARGTKANIARRLKALVTEFDLRAAG